jgi:hypothetical protein
MPRKHYRASNEQQGEISDGIARNLACAGLYVACTDIKSAAWRTVCNFIAWNKDLPIKPVPRGLSVSHMAAQRNCSQTDANAALVHA